MATTLNPARPFPGAGVYPLDSGHFDEAFAQTGTVRSPYATVVDALARQNLVELRERVRSNVERIGLSFGPGVPMTVDPVPRVIDAAEWEALEAGLIQRARALNAFLLDAYGDQRIFEDGVVPRRLLETSQGYEPRMRGMLDPGVPPATVAGMDLIRDAEGELLVLEDNLRMPSGATYAIAVREAVGPELPAEASAGLRRPDGYVARLGEAIRAAAPASHAAEPVAAILSDGPASGAYYEHERLGRELRLPVVEPPSSGPSAAACTPGSAVSACSSTSSTAGSTRTASPTRAAPSPHSARSSPPPSNRVGCAASTRSAPGSPTTSSPTPTSRRWSASTSARSRCCAPFRATTSPTPRRAPR